MSFQNWSHSAGLQFFAIALLDISQTNDMKIKAILDEVGDLCRIPLIEIQASTRIFQKDVERILPNVINNLRCKIDFMQFPLCDQMIVALLQHPQCTAALIRNNSQFFKALLPESRFKRIAFNQLGNSHHDKKLDAQFWRNYLAILSLDIVYQYVNQGQNAKQFIAQSPNKFVNRTFATSVDSPMKPALRNNEINVHEQCFEHICDLVNANMTGFLTADTVITLLMLYQDKFIEIIESQVSSKFELMVDILNYLVQHKFIAEIFILFLQESIKIHSEKLISTSENNCTILFMFLTLDSPNYDGSVDDAVPSKIAQFKTHIFDKLIKKPEAIIKILQVFGNELIRLPVNNGKNNEIAQYENTLLDKNHIVFKSLLTNINLCQCQLRPQDIYCLAHNKLLYQSIIKTPVYLAMLLQHERCDELLDFHELANQLSIASRASKEVDSLSIVQLCYVEPNYVVSLTPANLIKLITSHNGLADLILSDLNCMAKLLKSNEFTIPLMRRFQDKINEYLAKPHHKPHIEEFTYNIYLKLLATRIVLAKKNAICKYNYCFDNSQQ